MSNINEGHLRTNSKIGINYCVINITKTQIINAIFVICCSIYIEVGLNFCLISALKSVSNPSDIKQMINNNMPNIIVGSMGKGFILLPQKNITIPIETIIPIGIF